MNVLAIDQGTSGTKAVVTDAEGSVRGVAECAVRPTYLPGGGVEQDANALLASVLDAGREAIRLARIPVSAVSLANQGETVLAWDLASGRPLSPAVVWQDRRSEAICASLSAHGDQFAQRTGLVLDPYFSAPKMAWLRQEVTTEGVVTTSDAWLVHQLCGEFVTDATTASRSLITDLDTLQWDPELADLFGLGDERRPRIVSCDEVVGECTLFGGQLPVGGLIVDQQAALLAHGCFSRGAAKCTFGTGAFLLANTGASGVRSTAGLASSAAWKLRRETCYSVDGQVYAAGSALRWLQQIGLLESVTSLDAVTADDAAGVLCVPSLAGLGAPWWRPSATASFTGMTLSTQTGELVRSVLEGIAGQLAELIDLVKADLGCPLDQLRVDGGLTASARLMQATADVTQVAIAVYPSAHATALGAAATARLSLDAGLTVADAVNPWTPQAVYQPAWSPDRAGDYRQRWRAAVAPGAAGSAS